MKEYLQGQNEDLRSYFQLYNSPVYNTRYDARKIYFKNRIQ